MSMEERFDLAISRIINPCEEIVVPMEVDNDGNFFDCCIPEEIFKTIKVEETNKFKKYLLDFANENKHLFNVRSKMIMFK